MYENYADNEINRGEHHGVTVMCIDFFLIFYKIQINLMKPAKFQVKWRIILNCVQPHKSWLQN